MQRCHDFDVTGWLALLVMVLASALLFCLMPGSTGPNRWGPKTPPNSKGMVAAAWIGAALLLIATGFIAPACEDYLFDNEDEEAAR